MLDSLYAKLAAILTALFALVGLAVFVVALLSTDVYQQEVVQRLNSQLADHIVAKEKLLLDGNQVNRKALEDIFHMLMVINPSIEVYLLDPQGKIRNYSAAPGKVKRSRVDLAPVRKWLAGPRDRPVTGDDPRSPGGRKVFSAARIPSEGELQGYLYVILGGETYDSVVQNLKGSYILKLSFGIILGTLLFALIAGLLLFAALTRRLKKLARAMEQFHRGGMQTEAAGAERSPPSRDEIGRLAQTFQTMAARIDEQIGQLKRSDTLRRELVANVSHDLRTPLATLQGYIETVLLKDGQLDPRQRRDYLQTAIRHCERLGSLVQDLFELAKLDADDVQLVREPFHLSELVQDVVQKFKLNALKKNIDLTTAIQDGAAFVQADIGLIERVLENLIENALRHTPAGGQVELILTRRASEVVVEVRDTGQGIAEKHQPLIFDRFYRVDSSRGSSPGHSGLGLAISKRIVELHNRSIEVDSALDQGTVFSFSLPIHRPA